METHVDWTSPAALWHQFNGVAAETERRVFRTPAILRFATDAYMQELLNLMQTDPHRMSERLAVPEKWTQRVPDSAPIVPKRGLIGQLERARAVVVQKLEAKQQQGLVRSSVWNDASADPLKLYHPASQRYYVVTACLICRSLGLPDRPINTSSRERVSFVVRMLQSPDNVINPDPSAYSELAFVNGKWEAVSGTSLATGEEQNLMSPLTYVEDDGRKRRMFNAVVPVAKRETYLGAPQPAAVTAPAPIDARQILLKLKVIGPWANLEDVALRPITVTDGLPAAADLLTANAQIQTVSWLILLDLAAWLREHLDPVWEGVVNGRNTLTDPKHVAAWDTLNLTSFAGESLIDVLRVIDVHATTLESADTPYPSGPPRFQFVHALTTGAAGLTGTSTRETFETTLMAALTGTTAPSTVPVNPIAQINTATHITPWFVIRCVYERPLCGTVAPIISEPTASFQLASFFDPDAPARPIRVEMPADTTPAGLRKFDKNTAFVMSDVLCGQVGKLRGMTFGDLIRSVLPFPLHKDLSVGGMAPCTDGGNPAGMVCSFSIPIITICALLLLMIIVKLLDIVFFWMPFFQICLPVPNFKAKG